MSPKGVAMVRRAMSMLREFMAFEAAGGLTLLGAALAGMLVANSAAAPFYFQALEAHLGPLSVLHWVNDGMMAIFFLLVGLEIKYELLRGELSTPAQRVLPGLGALAGMATPALVFMLFNHGDPLLSRGWAIPAATDIAFALGLLSLFGKRVPSSLGVFLAALAIIDDLGAVLIIAFFYGGDVAWGYLLAGAAVTGVLVTLNRLNVKNLAAYGALGLALWACVLNSGVHATLAGVILAFTIPLEVPGSEDSPLHRMESRIDRLVPFVLVPIFGFANAGVSLQGVNAESLFHPLNLGIMLGLLLGKGFGIFLACAFVIRFFGSRLPEGTTWSQFFGLCFVCGIGFTMSLFINMLAFAGQPELVIEAKIGIILGSLCSAVVGSSVLWLSSKSKPG